LNPTSITKHRQADSLAKYIRSNLPEVIILTVVVVAEIIVVTYYLILDRGIGGDWVYVYRPAILEIFSWRSPYNIPYIINPPWTLLPLMPFALLPAQVGAVTMIFVSLGIFYFVARRFGAVPLVAAALLFSPAVVLDILAVNVNSLVAVGLLLPPQIGLFFVLIKPQMGAAIALFWLVEAWREGGFLRVVRVFAPVTIAFLVTFLIYGLWPLRMQGLMAPHPINFSLWPGSLPIGLVLLVYAIRKRDLRFALFSAPMFSPYMMLTAWMFPLLGLSKHRLETYVAIVGLWAVFFLQS
jgi:hypothetical protein